MTETPPKVAETVRTRSTAPCAAEEALPNASNGHGDLYPRILGEAWKDLPGSIRSGHAVGVEKRGRFRVTHGRNYIARQMARWSNLPPQDDSAPVVLQIHAENDSQRWDRRFGTHGFTTLQWADGGRLVERFDGWELHFALRVNGQTLVYEQCAARLCLGSMCFPVPLIFAPRVQATEESAGPNRVHVRVTVTLPLLGLLIAYDGHLEVGELES